MKSTQERVAVSLDRLLRLLESEQSRRAYKSDWKRYVDWAEDKGLGLLEVTPADVEDHVLWLRGKGNKKTTCARALSVIRESYRILVRDGILKVNPAREVKNPKLDHDPKTPWLTVDQVKQLLLVPAESWGERRDRLCIQLLLGLGWRRSEIARLRVEDFQNGLVRSLKKRAKLKDIKVPSMINKKIERWCIYAGIASGALLPRSEDDQRPISGDMLYRILHRSLARAGLPKFSPHALRRTYTTILHARGVDLRHLQVSLSHSSITTTEKYSKVDDELKISPGDELSDLLGDD